MIPAHIAYALGALGLTLPGQTFGTYLAFYYLDHLGLAASAFALARLVFSVWDAVNDPLFGYLSDRTRTPWGRRRPWLFVGLPFLLLAFYLTFSVPGPFLQGPALFWYCLGVILLFETFAALTWVNHAALFPELFRKEEERARANAWRQGFYFVGLAVSIALTPLVYTALGFPGMALLYGGLGGLLVLLFLKSIREDPKAQEAEPLPFIPAFRYTLGNQAFWIYSLAALFLLFAVGLFGAAMPFYAKYALGLGPEATSLLFATVLLAALPSVFLWARLAGTLGSKGAWLLAIFLLALGALLLFLPRTLLEALPVGLLIGAGVFGALGDRERVFLGAGCAVQGRWVSGEGERCGGVGGVAGVSGLPVARAGDSKEKGCPGKFLLPSFGGLEVLGVGCSITVKSGPRPRA